MEEGDDSSTCVCMKGYFEKNAPNCDKCPTGCLDCKIGSGDCKLD